MAITYESKSTLVSASGTSFVLTKPSGTVDGNYLLLVWRAETHALGAIAGWPELLGVNLDVNENAIADLGDSQFNVKYHVASSEPADYTYTPFGGGTATGVEIVMLRYSGVDAVIPIRASATDDGETTTVGWAAASGFVDDLALAVALVGKVMGSPTCPTPALWTSDHATELVNVSHKAVSVAGSVTVPTIDISPANDWASDLIILRPETVGSGFRDYCGGVLVE